MASNRHDYSEDMFAHTRMSFGDHLDELRTRMWNAIKALLFCLVIGFVLDGIGSAMDWKWFGLGKPALELIKAPVEKRLNQFYDERAWKALDEKMGKPNSSEKEAREEQKTRFLAERERMRRSSSDDLNKGQEFAVQIKRAELRKAVEANGEENVTLNLQFPAIDFAVSQQIANERVGKRNQLSTLSAQEMFVVYFKVTLMCGLILASPLVFYQFWAFVGAGLYPHERKYVHVYLPFSIGLFLAGVALCFIWVLPGTVKALLAFNDWLGVDPDLRISEWLNLAIILPLVFGISFQTPLMMLFLNRIGMFTWQAYLSKWRQATMVLAVFAAVITPTPDAVTMLYLFIPMLGLYFLGILLCKWMPRKSVEEEEEAASAEVAV